MDLKAATKNAVDRFNQGEVVPAIDELLHCATAGHLPAQVFVGWMYEVGKGVTADPAEAQQWYTRAAESGDMIAQYYLGRLLSRLKEPAEGARWLRSAAEQGYAPAMYWLGRHYADGRGLERNESEAARYIEMAAEAGHLFAQRWMASRGIKGKAGVAGFCAGLRWFLRLPITAFRAEWKDHPDRNLRYP